MGVRYDDIKTFVTGVINGTGTDAQKAQKIYDQMNVSKVTVKDVAAALGGTEDQVNTYLSKRTDIQTQQQVVTRTSAAYGNTYIPNKVTGFKSILTSSGVVFAWDKVTGAATYNLYLINTGATDYNKQFTPLPGNGTVNNKLFVPISPSQLSNGTYLVRVDAVSNDKYSYAQSDSEKIILASSDFFVSLDTKNIASDPSLISQIITSDTGSVSREAVLLNNSGKQITYGAAIDWIKSELKKGTSPAKIIRTAEAAGFSRLQILQAIQIEYPNFTIDMLNEQSLSETVWGPNYSYVVTNSNYQVAGFDVRPSAPQVITSGTKNQMIGRFVVSAQSDAVNLSDLNLNINYLTHDDTSVV